MHLTATDIRRLFPRAREDYVRLFTGNGVLLAQYGLSDPLPLCHFLARAGGPETGGLRIVEENGNYSAQRLREVWPNRFTEAQARVYAGKPQAILSRAYARKELGNGPEATGDGWRYRGRGLMQTTGKANYARMGAKLKVDLVANPDLLATDLTLGLKAALIEWQELGLTAICNRLGPTHEAVLAVARGINLGNPNSRKQPNGLKDQKDAFARAWKLFGNGVAPRVDPAADGILQEGEEGEAVRDLQTRLKALGYPIGEPDGVFGERTEAAVAAFQAREALGGDPGKWLTAWTDRLATAKPFENAARQEVTAKDLAEKGNPEVGALKWLQNAAAAVAAFLGLDRAADQAGIQWPDTLGTMREAMEPLTNNLAWLLGNRWALGIAAAIGVYGVASWLTARAVKRYRSFGVNA